MFESTRTLFLHILARIDASEGRLPNTKEWTPGRWHGWTYDETPPPVEPSGKSTKKSEPEYYRLCMENEDTGELVRVSIAQDGWRSEGQYAVDVTKRYIISSKDETWYDGRGKQRPGSEQQLEALIFHICEIHSTGAYTLFDQQFDNELQKLKDKAKEDKATIERLRMSLSELQDQHDYY